jgi:hypothetical protein
VFKFGGCLGLCTLPFSHPTVLYLLIHYIWDNVSFKFGGEKKHTIFLFVFVYKKKKKMCYVVVKHELHCNYGYISWVC